MEKAKAIYYTVVSSKKKELYFVLYMLFGGNKSQY